MAESSELFQTNIWISPLQKLRSVWCQHQVYLDILTGGTEFRSSCCLSVLLHGLYSRVWGLIQLSVQTLGFWPQPLVDADPKHPAEVVICFTPYSQITLGNSVHLGCLRRVRQQIWGDFFLNMSPLQLPNYNAKDRCNFICCLSCWIPRKFISLPLTNPKGTCNPMISDYLSETLSTEICATLLCT